MDFDQELNTLVTLTLSSKFPLKASSEMEEIDWSIFHRLPYVCVNGRMFSENSGMYLRS